jgi:histidine triad (HIT) family protein
MASIFSKIVAGEIPCHKVAEDENHLAFLDIMPLKMGHVLVIPKKEVDYIFDIPADELAALHLFAQKVSKAIVAAIPCKRVGVAVIGLEVPHAHIHLIPMTAVSDMDFTRPKLNPTSEQLAETAALIQSKLI